MGGFIQRKQARKRIMPGTVAVYAVGFSACFGFIASILSGNLNSN